ncbi:uncharacterized protein LOC123506242 [Portunus trituberculatus]|uniref:uncharacterized protein LOC123506242 n=1 Tax=Portunus trituberculatus TaxID=210409 RepID=UPI001E1D0975|nr:uncharacterized protein LOC123506242 [Portunus trituberculatus]
MRVWQVVMVAAALAVAVTEAQRPRFRPPQVRIPSRAELTVAINNVDTVKKALACIEGLPCKLDDEYHVMLQRWGPEVMLRGQCPAGLCTREQAREAKWLMSQIYEKYPKRYIATVNRLATRPNPYYG